MADFVVKMADERGHVLEQVEPGYSAGEVRERFSQQGFLVYSVRPRNLLSGARVGVPQRRKIKLEQFVVFNSQFLTLIRAGLPITQVLDLLIKRQPNAYFRSLLENIRDRVKAGELLSDAFAAQGVFPKIHTTTLLAGEKSGNLEEVLSRYIQFQRMALTFRKKLLASLVYPTLLVVLVTVMLVFLFTYVVPKFGDFYQQVGNGDLPGITLFMLSVGKGAQHYVLLMLPILAAVIVGFLYWRKSESGSRKIDAVRMKTPVLGEVWLKYQVAMFSRMLSTLLSGGLPLVPALNTAGGSIQSKMAADAILESANRVREGKPLARSLEDTGRMPELAVEMIEVGESTGALPAMLNSVAEFYEEDVQTSLTAIMSLVEPAILIVMGCVVALVLISLYLPIFRLGAGIH